MSIGRTNCTKEQQGRRKRLALHLVKCAVFAEALDLLDDDDRNKLKELYEQRRKQHVSQLRRTASKNRRFRKRQSWTSFQSKLTDTQFRRYFRMERGCFRSLCRKIEEAVGDSEFKSESYLRNLRTGAVPNSVKQKFDKIHQKTTGGFISGEIKVAMTLRLLAGGSYLDLGLLYEMSFSYTYEIFHHVVKNWINNDKLVKISGKDFFDDENKLKESATEFARKSNGLMWGAVGALDGWLVKIRQPSKIRDRVKNPASFFSRKGFFAVNVQVIVDRKKRVLCRSMLCRGAEHDSSAFKQCSLHKALQRKWNWLREKGCFILGDSACALRSYLLTPFDRTVHGTAKDNYNFFHSSSRICVECAFGEIDMRWGILWKPLKFNLVNSIQVIDACLRLHNFIVDYRQEKERESVLDELERSVFNEDSRRFLAVNPGHRANGAHEAHGEDLLDENGARVIACGGRPSTDDVACREAGVEIRESISSFIANKKERRPQINWFRENNRVLEIE